MKTEIITILLLGLTAVATAMPRFIAIPIEDLEFSQSVPLIRVARAVQRSQAEEVDSRPLPVPLAFEEFASSSNVDQQAERRWEIPDQHHASSSFGHNDHVDYGAYTGKKGAFGWYTDHPVLVYHH